MIHFVNGTGLYRSGSALLHAEVRCWAALMKVMCDRLSPSVKSTSGRLKSPADKPYSASKAAVKSAAVPASGTPADLHKLHSELQGHCAARAHVRESACRICVCTQNHIITSEWKRASELSDHAKVIGQ